MSHRALNKEQFGTTCEDCISAADDAGVETHGIDKWRSMDRDTRVKEQRYLLDQGYAGCEKHPAY